MIKNLDGIFIFNLVKFGTYFSLIYILFTYFISIKEPLDSEKISLIVYVRDKFEFEQNISKLKLELEQLENIFEMKEKENEEIQEKIKKQKDSLDETNKKLSKAKAIKY